ncbi:hypothetical protein BUALT_Bualt04G0038600 [Buddleja alternifolia]|uniref:Intermembrane lipid transfer protein VPS13-like C-terminal domain-containing protein n=1 Tax=Buddleja alternifolia TaxID=168488 RepID=A0AAV6XL42_9LAMI|nr:hypothetical protein BUALT_Bualt04G0038600 [Buddleja alternifolia]
MQLTSNGPLLEFLLRNSIIRSILNDNEIEGSVRCDLQVNYYNIDKVLWEPFMETWKFQLSMSRRHDERALFNKDIMTDINLESATHLNESIIEAVILNATSVSLEVRFDIPFGVAPKIIDPIYPGQEFPVPLHLAETGCIRWRPLGESYLWSEAYNMSSIISQDVRIGFLRSFVCYPSHPSSEAFRCCISVSDQCLLPVGRSNRVYSPIDADSEYAGVARTSFLSEVETSFYHIDSSHALSITFQMHGFRPSTLNYPRAESFSAKAKFSGTKFSISEIIRFDPDFNDGPLYVTMEKVMDAVSGAREIFISVPLLLFNCTGFSLVLSIKSKGNSCVIPSCYNLDEQNILIEKKDGLGVVCPDQDIAAKGEENLNLPSCRKVTACVFSPDPHSSSGEVMVKLSRMLPCVVQNYPKGSWSAQFSILPQTGSTSVIVPQPSLRSSGYVLSVSAVAAPFSGTTKIITFQPSTVTCIFIGDIIMQVFGSAGVIGNPLGFARSLGLGIKEFFSLPIWSVLQSPSGLLTGMAQGTTSLFSNTVYAISDATSQFTKAAHKGIVAFTLDDQTVTMTEWQQKGMSSHSKGVINEFLEGLAGVLQSPIKVAEKHGLPGVISGLAVGVTGLVAKPAASILEVTGKTAQSIRNRSKTYQMGFRHFRIRLPRPLSSESPLKPYSWEEAVGTYVLTENDMKLRDEMLVMCKSLKQCGQYALITRRLILVVSCSSLIELGRPTFEGVPANPKWNIKSEIGMDSVILADNDGDVVHIVGSGSDTLFRQNLQQKRKGKLWYNFDTPLPLVQTNLEFTSPEEADEFLRVVMCMIEWGKEQGWGSSHILHQTNIK